LNSDCAPPGRFDGEFAIVYRNFPLPTHVFAREAALASECAARQGRFREMHELLFDASDSFGLAGWRSFAERANVSDLASFEDCLRDPASGAAVDRDIDAGERLGVRGTPTILVNGYRYRGALTERSLDSLLTVSLRAALPTR
jgi:protein-disulfide isomerase